MILYLKTNGDTTITYEYPLEYEGYGLGLVRLDGKIKTMKNRQLFLCCDIIEESYLKNKKLPILYPVIRDENGNISCDINKVLYLKVVRPSISSIRLYICDIKGKIVSLSKNFLDCVLLIVPRKNESSSY